MIKLTNSFTEKIKKKKPHGTDRGFSLAELLVVVVIMVVLVGVTAPILISHIIILSQGAKTCSTTLAKSSTDAALESMHTRMYALPRWRTYKTP